MAWLKKTIDETTGRDDDNVDLYAGGIVVAVTVATVLSVWSFGL